MAWGKDSANNGVTCSEVGKPDIYIEVKARQKIQYLMEEYTSQEWLGYLVGRESEKKNFFVEDLVVPPHAEASGACAEAEPNTVPEGCVGIIHSHHSMGAFHSHTDKTYADRNHPISITVARRQGELEYDGVSLQRTPCGKLTTVACDVRYVAPPPAFDKDEWLEEAKENIAKGKKVVTVVYPQSPFGRTVYRGTHHSSCTGTKGLTKAEKKALKKARKEVEKPRPLVTQEDIEELNELYVNQFGQTLTRAEVEDMLANGDPRGRGLDYWD